MLRNYKNILVNILGHQGQIILNRPEKGNALSLEMCKDLTSIIKEFEINNQIHVIVLTGSGMQLSTLFNNYYYYFMINIHLEVDKKNCHVVILMD